MIHHRYSKPRIVLQSIVAVAVMAAATFVYAQTRGAAAPVARAAAPTAVQDLTFTCMQAWVASEKSYPKMLAIVTTLARVSLANRHLTLPNTREAGVDAGRGIAEDCKADPHALLFAIVDTHVRRVAEPGGR